MRAAVVSPEAEVRSWFSWPIPTGLIDQLVAEGRLARPARGQVAIAG
jgi:hypothetical protein